VVAVSLESIQTQKSTLFGIAHQIVTCDKNYQQEMYMHEIGNKSDVFDTSATSWKNRKISWIYEQVKGRLLCNSRVLAEQYGVRCTV
jgi:hypothetical protein